MEKVNCKRERRGGAGKTDLRERNKEVERKNNEYDMLVIKSIKGEDRKICEIQKE